MNYIEAAARAVENMACALAREGRKSDRYGFCGHARCGHFHEAADAIRALAHAARGEGGPPPWHAPCVLCGHRQSAHNTDTGPCSKCGCDCAAFRPTPPPATGEGFAGLPVERQPSSNTPPRPVTPGDLARSLDAVASMIDGATSLDNVARIQRERDEAQKVLTDMLTYVEREHGTDADEGMCDEDDPCDMAVLIKRAHAALGTSDHKCGGGGAK